MSAIGKIEEQNTDVTPLTLIPNALLANCMSPEMILNDVNPLPNPPNEARTPDMMSATMPLKSAVTPEMMLAANPLSWAVIPEKFVVDTPDEKLADEPDTVPPVLNPDWKNETNILYITSNPKYWLIFYFPGT